jgi:hypothetical protein
VLAVGFRKNMVRKHPGTAAINAEWKAVVVKVGFLATVRARWHYRPCLRWQISDRLHDRVNGQLVLVN